MNATLIYPSKSHTAYKIAADTFAALATTVAGCITNITTDEEYLSKKTHSDLTVVIGSDAVNSVLADLYLTRKTDSLGIIYGKDNYLIRTEIIDGQSYLFLAGGRPRATIYAVYRYFELFHGCRWFWDGDRIPKAELKISGINLVESPRFDYRGIRYFAHRSLHRFQAEHWSYDDWTKEIDWLMKSRLNLFMLRIGTDDLFQRAFPDIVNYPETDAEQPETAISLNQGRQGYNDRNLFWSLEYRGKLRKKILKYAFERDLMHPEDCGTMTHWYSRTPVSFLEKVKPTLLSQSTKGYSEQTGLVFDVRKKENIDLYFKLTDTHVKEYGKPEIFHTIGLAERLYSNDKEENMRMKLYVYRMLSSRLKEKYPNAPLLIAAWDLWMYYTPEEVQALVSELDPEQAIIFDYTSDTMRENNFTRWGVVNKFPWIFGLFSGFEPSSEIRGFYKLTNERLKIAKADEMCKGMVLWPELSHGDPLFIYYLAKNAWEKSTPEISELTDSYAHDRYPEKIADGMAALWQKFMPIVMLKAWSVSKDDLFEMLGNDLFHKIDWRAKFNKDGEESYHKLLTPVLSLKDTAAEILTELSKIIPEDELTRRDQYDISRTLIGRYIDCAILLAEYSFAKGGDIAKIEEATKAAESLTELLCELLSTHEDYSLCDSLIKLRSVTYTNPNFEKTLKNNAECEYCRSYIYENVKYLYLPEMKLLFNAVKQAAEENKEFDVSTIKDSLQEIRNAYFNTPLEKMKCEARPICSVVSAAAQIIKNLHE